MFIKNTTKCRQRFNQMQSDVTNVTLLNQAMFIKYEVTLVKYEVTLVKYEVTLVNYEVTLVTYEVTFIKIKSYPL